MKKGVPNPEQNSSHNKREPTKLATFQSLFSRAITWIQSALFGLSASKRRIETVYDADNNDLALRQEAPPLRTIKAPIGVQQLEEVHDNSLLNTCPLEILAHILSFANNPAASLVSRNLCSAQREVLRLKYNLNKESLRPTFVKHRNEKGEDTNDATITQQKEIEIFLRSESMILNRTNKDEKVLSCFTALKKEEFNTINPDAIMKFLAREKILDELNAAIIEARISKYKIKNNGKLSCKGLCLTRFPGKIITKHFEFFKTLRNINLRCNYLQSLPPEIGQLVALQELDLGMNNLQSFPPEIGQLVALQKLDLFNNYLQILPPEIGQLVALEELELYHNQLKSLPPEIRKLNALQKFKLGNNGLQSLPPEIGQLVALQELDLSYNQLPSLPPEIGQLEVLQKLRLDRNKLQSLPSEIGQLMTLQGLDLRENKLQNLPPEFGQLRALQALWLRDNELKYLPPEIGQLEALQIFILDYNRLQSLPSEIGKLRALQQLYLGYNQLQSLPPEIGQFVVLEKLDLEENQLKSLPPEIGQLAGLKELELNDNYFKSLPDNLRADIFLYKISGKITKAQVLDMQKKQPADEVNKAINSPGK